MRRSLALACDTDNGNEGGNCQPNVPITLRENAGALSETLCPFVDFPSRPDSNRCALHYLCDLSDAVNLVIANTIVSVHSRATRTSHPSRLVSLPINKKRVLRTQLGRKDLPRKIEQILSRQKHPAGGNTFGAIISMVDASSLVALSFSFRLVRAKKANE